MSIKSIKGKYLMQADRLLLSIINQDNTQFKLILTRRLTKKIFLAFENFIAQDAKKNNPGFISDEIKKFNKELSLQGISFNEKKMDDPVEETKNLPYFISDIKFKNPTKGKDKKNIIFLSLITSTQKEINISCGIKLMNIFNELLMKFEKKADWGLAKKEVELLPKKHAHNKVLH